MEPFLLRDGLVKVTLDSRADSLDAHDVDAQP